MACDLVAVSASSGLLPEGADEICLKTSDNAGVSGSMGVNLSLPSPVVLDRLCTPFDSVLHSNTTEIVIHVSEEHLDLYDLPMMLTVL